jgi:uncharacterized protein with PIN domain
MFYVLRFIETGRDAQNGRRKLQRDISAVLEHRIPSAKLASGVGRIYLETEYDVRDVLANVHGLISFSPCLVCSLTELSASVLSLARCSLLFVQNFAVRVKQSGQHAVSSQQIAARLGREIQAEMPGLGVDLRQPQAFIGVEINEDRCFVFDAIVPGIDSRTRESHPTDETRFVADQMLGTLATWLRLLGFDTVELPHVADSALLRIARAEQRVLLTRDGGLARARSASVLFLKEQHVAAQLKEVSAALDLRFDRARMFTRCTLCNRELEVWPKAKALGRVPAKVYAEHDSFMHCGACDKLYWQGDHHARILAQVEALF